MCEVVQKTRDKIFVTYIIYYVLSRCMFLFNDHATFIKTTHSKALEYNLDLFVFLEINQLNIPNIEELIPLDILTKSEESPVSP